MKTRIFTLLVAFLAIAGNAVWGQEHTFPGGDGSKDNPYQISTADDLKAFRDLVNGGDADACAKLTGNINLNPGFTFSEDGYTGSGTPEEWEPIRYISQDSFFDVLSYTGTFDGDGHTISGLYISDDKKNYGSGLFGVVGVFDVMAMTSTGLDESLQGVVKNLTVKGNFISTETSALGGICAYNVGTIQNCTNEITTDISSSGKGNVGGICANNFGIITACVNNGTIQSSTTAGGICAMNSGTIEKCYNAGEIKGSANIGGISGEAGDGYESVIKNCYNSGNITFVTPASDGALRTASGICCILQSITDKSTQVEITNCHNYGEISGAARKAGICTFPNKKLSNGIEVTVSNNYYLENTADAGFLYVSNVASEVGTPNDQPSQTEAKSADAFANGEVLYLLQQNNPGVWKQGEKYPVFLTDEEEETTVYQVTFNYNYEGSPEAIIYYVEEGESVTVPTLTREGYTFTNWSTDATGESVAEISGSITPDASVTYYAQWQEEQTEDPDEGDDDEQGGIVPDAPKYYNIYEDEICEGVTVEFSRDVVKEGQSVLVTITVDEEFDATKMTLKFKRSLFGYWEDLTLTPTENPNEYIIQNIYTDIYVRAEGAVPTGIEQIAGAQVYTRDGSLFVRTPQPEQVLVISASGAILKNERFAGLRQFDNLSRGVYIICIGNERFKVRI